MKELEIPFEKYNNSYVAISVESRIFFLKRFAERVKKENIPGSVAEAGVYRGEFAKEINKNFSDRTCYLFDTFEGFSDSDIEKEELSSLVEAHHLKETSHHLVLDKMEFKDKVVIKKGHFPDTALDDHPHGLQEESFVFVNLDMDLYQPTFEGLKFFYPKMSDGGIILIHDYFSEAYPNVEKAVDDFQKEYNVTLKKMPIGDDISLAIIK